MNELQTKTSDIISNEQKNMIFENMSDGIIMVDADGIISYLNSACAAILQSDGEELIGNAFRNTFLTNRKNKEFNRLFNLCFQKNMSFSRQVVKYHSGQEIHYFNIEVSLINPKETVFGKGNFQGMMVLIEDVTDSYQLKQQERDCAMIFAGIIICISVYLSAWSLLHFTLRIPLKTSDYTLMIEGITLLLFLEIVFCTSFSLRQLGLIPKISRLLHDAKQTLLIAVIACSVLLAAKTLLLFLGLPVKSRFIGGSIGGATTYIFTAFLQEFLARGVIQTSVKHLMHVKYQKQFGILLTSLLFSLMHLPFGFIFMLGAFALSIALGILFEQQRSIWGCAFLHWSVGYLAMCLFF